MPHTLKPVRSLADLAAKAAETPAYAQLAMLAASNLGGSARTVAQAMSWLRTTADETSEDGVVEEVNFCLDLVTELP